MKLFCAALIGLILCPPIAAAPPNVVLVITDDQGYGDLGCHGNPHLRTPNLDRLAAESVRFDRFFVSPLCAPTRVSLLTGRYSLRTGVAGVSAGAETMRAEEVTIAEVLRSAGYRTGLFGKWHNGEHYPHTPNGQGFEEAFGYNLGHWNNYFDTTLKHNGKPVKTRGYIADVVTDAALTFIDAPGDRPFFCYLALPTPHSPFQVPDADFDRHRKLGLDPRLSCVYGMCENIDANVGRVLKRLDDRKLRENTIVLFLTDNGPNGARFNAGMRGTKGTLHEGGSRVPLFVRWPARLKPRVVPQIAAHIDILPTLAELCGSPAPKTLPLDGRSLVPLLDGNAEAWPDRTLFTQHQLVPKAKPLTGAARTQRYRLVGTGGRWELFDMEKDPGQERNVATDHPDLAKGLRAAFEGWYAEVRKGAEDGRPPIPVGHAEEDPVELPAAQAAFAGGLKFSGRHPNNAWLVGWANPAAEATWSLDVVRPGDYAVSLLYLCPAASAGTTVEVAAGGAKTAAALAETPIRRIPSPDRVPRDEVYEMEWATLPAGTLTLPKGAAKLTVRPMEVVGKDGFELKAVVLRRK